MKVRLCPYCDSEMKKSHRCDVCNSFVWKPNVLDIHYNTEERGLGEVDCAYGSGHDDVHHEEFRTRKVSRKINGKKISPVFIIIVVFWVIGALFQAFESIFEDVGVENLTPEPSDAPLDAFEVMYYSLFEEELDSYTGACSYTMHMPIVETDAVSAVKDFIVQMGWENTTVCETRFYGYVDRSEYLEKAYYENDITYYPFDDYDNEISITADALTEELHSVDAVFESADDAAMFAYHFAVNALGAENFELSDFTQLFTENEDGFASLYYDVYGIITSYYEYSDSWEVSIYCSECPYSYDAERNTVEVTSEYIQENGQPGNINKPIDGLYGEDVIPRIESWLQAYGIDTIGAVYESNFETIIEQSPDVYWTERHYNTYTDWAAEEGDLRVSITTDSYSDALYLMAVEGIEYLDDCPIYAELFVETLGLNVTPDALAEALVTRYAEDGYAFVSIDDVTFYMTDYGGFCINVEKYR